MHLPSRHITWIEHLADLAKGHSFKLNPTFFMDRSVTTELIRPQLNISLESEHLNPEEIKAHEADTLPMGNGPGDTAAGEGEGKPKKKGETSAKFGQKKKELFDKLQGFATPFLAEENPLPQSPTTKDKVLQERITAELGEIASPF